MFLLQPDMLVSYICIQGLTDNFARPGACRDYRIISWYSVLSVSQFLWVTLTCSNILLKMFYLKLAGSSRAFSLNSMLS